MLKFAFVFPWVGRNRCSLVATALLMVASIGFAQEVTPSADQMVQQLRTVRTRSLVVESAPTVRPALSLQIQFDFNSSNIGQESLAALSNLVQAMQSDELRHARFLVEGHTDAKGDATYNLKLSQQRASKVAQWLAAHGVDHRRLDSVGKGSGEPANADDPLAAQNRRVRIVNVGE